MKRGRQDGLVGGVKRRACREAGAGAEGERDLRSAPGREFEALRERKSVEQGRSIGGVKTVAAPRGVDGGNTERGLMNDAIRSRCPRAVDAIGDNSLCVCPFGQGGNHIRWLLASGCPAATFQGNDDMGRRGIERPYLVGFTGFDVEHAGNAVCTGELQQPQRAAAAS